MYRIGVIGGGASGFFSAIQAASAGHKVTVFEKSPNVLSKVRVSGGGRCNVTHDCLEISRLVKFYPRGERFLKKVFGHFSVKDTFGWFQSRGVSLKVEGDGRVFPVSDDSQSIISVLLTEADRLNVKVMTKCRIDSIKFQDKQFVLEGEGMNFNVDKTIVTTGGNAKISAYDWLRVLGHTIVPPIPSLFTFNTPHEPITDLQGISLPDAHIRLEKTKLSYCGPLLITHWGLSGPAVLKLSAFGAKWLHETDYVAKCVISWDSHFREDQLRRDLLAYQSSHPKKRVAGNPLFQIPSRLWIFLVHHTGIGVETLWHQISKKQIHKLLENLFRFTLEIRGKTTFKEEFVTSGGVSLEEINPQTMESKLVSGLYFAGEVIDVDGITGGFNFQSAWSTGYLAGISASQ